MRVLSSMVITAKRDEVLNTLRENLKRHSSIVEEARKGYVAKAERALEAKLDEIVSGKVVALTFTLAPPQDYSHVYETAIKMLEMHTEATVELDSEQVRHLVMDEWDWMQQFLGSNFHYSNAAQEYAASKHFKF